MAKSKRLTQQSRPRSARKRASTRGSSETRLELPDGLTPKQHAFCLAYLSNGFNASAAYRSAHQGATQKTSSVEGHRNLAKPSIAAFLKRQLEAQWSLEEMAGAEAAARVSRDARADVRQLFDAKGRMLPPHEWPDSIAGSVKAVEEREHGFKVTLVDPGTARRTMLEVTGRLKNVLEGTVDALADAIRRDRERHAKKGASA
jgi:phage terminase small subunit